MERFGIMQIDGEPRVAANQAGTAATVTGGRRGKRRVVAVAGGGTAGHVTSGLAIMLAYEEACGAEVFFVGCPGGFEKHMAEARGFTLKTIPGAPYARQGAFGKLRSMAALVRGTAHARRLLKSMQVDLVIGLGGYASAGAVVAARMLRIPAVIHEANVFPGLANRLVRRMVDHVFIGWEQAREFFPGSPVTVTGNPVLPEIIDAGVRSTDQRWNDGSRRILVTGGSEGSPFLNENAPLLLKRVRELGIDIAVLHQSGEGAAEQVRSLYREAGIEARVEPFIDQMAEAYSQTHFVIAAAGALTLAELATLGLPSLLAPLKTAANSHQVANAKAYEAYAGGAWAPEEDWNTELLAERMAAMLGDSTSLRAHAVRLREMARPHAARDVVNACEALLSRLVDKKI